MCSFAAWRLHNCHFNSSHFVGAFVAASAWCGWLFVTSHNPISMSGHARLQPLVAAGSTHARDGLVCSGALCDQHAYNATLHPPTPLEDFERGAFYEFATALALFDVSDDGRAVPALEAAFMLEAHEKMIKKKHGVLTACVSPLESKPIRDAARCGALFSTLSRAAAQRIQAAAREGGSKAAAVPD